MRNLFTPKKIVLYLAAALAAVSAYAQAPHISYSSPQVYPTGVAISPLAPVNTGGVVPFPPPLTIASNLYEILGIAVDGTGNVFVAITGTEQLGVESGIEEIPAGGGTPVVFGSGFRTPYNVAVDAAGNVYVADSGNDAVKKIPAGGGAVITLATGFTPDGITVDAAGNIYVGDLGSSEVKKLPVGGGPPVVIGTGLGGAVGLAVDAAGNVYVACEHLGAVKKILVSDGSVVTVRSGLGAVNGLALDGRGNLYIIYLNEPNDILELPAGGGSDVHIGLTSFLTAITVNAAGDIYTGANGGDAVALVKHGNYTVNPALPAGLNLDSHTGIITGTPCVATPASNYTVTTFNSAGSGSAIINIAVSNLPKPNISYSSPQVYSTATVISPLVPVNTGGAIPAPTSVILAPGFDNPTGIALDAAGNVYVTETINNDIKKIPAGGGVPVIIGTGFNQPTAVAVDAAGNIYVADSGNNAVKEIPAGGGATIVLGSGFKHPYGIALDASGNIYVSDAGNNMIKKIPAGNGMPVILASGFNAPAGVAVDATGNVYVADRGNNAIKKIPAAGGAPVTLATGSGNPNGVAVDAAAKVYFTDTNNNWVTEINAGSGTITLGSNLNRPDGVSVDATANVYVTDTGNGSIKEISPAAYAISSSLPPGLNFSGSTGVISGSPRAASPATTYTVTAGNSAGTSTATINVTVNAFPKPNISYASPQVFTAGRTISPLTPVNNGGAVPLQTSVQIASGFDHPFSIAANDAGDVYVADDYNNAIKKIPAGGGAVVTVSTAFNHPTGVALDKAGNIYVTDNGNKQVKEIPAVGGPIIILSTAFLSPYGIAVDASGNIYVSDIGNNTVKKIPAGGGTPVKLGTGFKTPTGLTIDGLGNVYVADRGNNLIKEILASNGSTVTLASGFSSPNAVALDAGGNIYEVDLYYSDLQRIPVGGGDPVVISQPGDFITPAGIALDNNGYIYVSDVAHGIIKKMNPGDYFINPTLPAGLAFDRTTGTISGKPTALIPATNYAITAYNSSGMNSATLNITVASGNAYLSNLKVSSGTLSPSFGYLTDSYTDTVANSTFSVTITPKTGDANATVTVNGATVASGTASAPVALAVGQNTIATVVTAQDGTTTDTYTITVTRAAPSNTYLSNLKISSGTLTPAFHYTTTGYSTYVDNAITSIKVTPTVAAAGSTVTVNGTAVASGKASGPIALNVGPNTITTVVTASDGVSTSTYTINVNRLNVYLSNLKINFGNVPLNPAFHYTTTSYTASVPNTTTTVKVTPALAYSGSSVTVNGAPVSSNTASNPIALSVGSNTINTVVTGADGVTTDTYTITITRAASNNANLSNLVLSSGTLSPAFASGTTSYTASVNTTSVTVTPTTADAGATVKVNGTSVASGTASGSIALALGQNTITTAVTAQDGTTAKTYTITVTRLSTNAYLSNLQVNYGNIALSPAFHYTTYNYTASATNATSSVNIEPTTADANATVKVNGTTVAAGAASPPIALSVGSNTIKTVVTAQDGTTTATYTINITRAAPMHPDNSVYQPIGVEKPIENLALETDGITVHQGLSPNGDGINDVLVVDGITNYPDNRLMIMNRSGALVYEAKGYDNSSKVFAGHSNKTGAKQLPGTYFYSLDYVVNGVIKHKTGFIVLKY